jgi:hypothetical protein
LAHFGCRRDDRLDGASAQAAAARLRQGIASTVRGGLQRRSAAARQRRSRQVRDRGAVYARATRGSVAEAGDALANCPRERVERIILDFTVSELPRILEAVEARYRQPEHSADRSAEIKQLESQKERLLTAIKIWRELVARCARTAIDEGHFRSDLDPEQFVYEFDGITMMYQQRQGRMRDRDAADHAQTAFESLLNRSRRSPRVR